ncbi:MAG: hypothetical protein HYR84_16610 [Planctomycetes bacterium]|nr:hypothetical protein [Planctomycetota bacterium]
MSTATCGPPDPKCEELLRQMAEAVKELMKRAAELIANEGDLPATKPDTPHPRYGTRSLQGERQAFTDRQRGLGNRMNDYYNSGCGDPPGWAMEWVTKPVPVPVPKPAPPVVDPKAVAETAAAGAAAVGIGYVIYRIVRLIPSLAFPPSLIPNLAIP